MKEFIDKLISMLEEIKAKAKPWDFGGVCLAIEIVNQLAEEYKISFMQELVEARRNCSEDSDCSQCLFGQIEDRCILAELQIDADIKKNNGWIPCSVQEEPTENGKYIVCVQHFENKDLYSTDFVYWLGEWKVSYDWNVIAWMPIAPYTEGE